MLRWWGWKPQAQNAVWLRLASTNQILSFSLYVRQTGAAYSGRTRICKEQDKMIDNDSACRIWRYEHSTRRRLRDLGVETMREAK